MPVDPRSTGMAPSPALLQSPVVLPHATPEKLASGNVVIVLAPPKLPPVPPVQTSEKAPAAVVQVKTIRLDPESPAACEYPKLSFAPDPATCVLAQLAPAVEQIRIFSAPPEVAV